MSLKSYFILALLIFVIGIAGLYFGVNHTANGNKPPVMHQQHDK
jgi:hypothetical protein